MTGWHCPRWANNLTGSYPQITFEDGDDCDQIYSEARCDSFSRSGYFTSDHNDEQIDSEMDTNSDAHCNEHDREANWEPDYEIHSELEEAGFYVCSECDQVYHEHHDYALHDLEEHGNEDDAGEPAFVYRTPASGRPVSSHSVWSLSG